MYKNFYKIIIFLGLDDLIFLEDVKLEMNEGMYCFFVIFLMNRNREKNSGLVFRN